MHTIKITPNLLFEYQCTSGKFIRLPNRIESKLFLPELECSTVHDFCLATPVASSHASRRRIYCVRCFSVDVATFHALLPRCTFSPTHAPVLNTLAFIQSTMTTPTTVIRLKHDTSFRLVRLSVRAGVPSIGVLRPACSRLLHRESKKQDTKLLAITSLTIIRFSKFFH